jgi:hypothetical protein
MPPEAARSLDLTLIAETLRRGLAGHVLSHLDEVGWPVCLCGHVCVDDVGASITFHAGTVLAPLLAPFLTAARAEGHDGRDGELDALRTRLAAAERSRENAEESARYWSAEADRLADAWGEGWEAGWTYVQNQHTNGIPHDPPVNPYEAAGVSREATP